MMEQQTTGNKLLWIGIRLILVLAMMPSSDETALAQIPEKSFLIAILGGLFICVGLFVWLFVVSDQSYKKPILDIFLFCPMFPFRKCASALWAIIGSLIFIGGCLSIFYDSQERYLLLLNISICIFGLCIVGTIFIVRWIKILKNNKNK